MKADLFLLPAREGARRLVLGLLREAEAAAARLGQRGDAEALHDLRVALHRLGCFLRDYRGQLSQVPSGLRKGFKKLAAATNPVRDKEAGIELLNAFAGKAAPAEKASLLAAAGLLKARGSRRGQGFAAGIRRELGVLSVELRTAISSVAPGAEGEKEKRPLAAVNGKAVRRHLRRLKAGLAGIRTLSDGAGIHRARLLTRKLRYILEPEARLSRKAARFVKKLVRLQYLLGKIHDIQVLYPLLRGAAAGETKGLAPGRAAAFLEEKEAGFFRELGKSWLGGRGRAFFGELRLFSRR